MIMIIMILSPLFKTAINYGLLNFEMNAEYIYL